MGQKTGYGGNTSSLTLFLSGDVMTGRGIDQIFPHPLSPRLHEPYVVDARDYVALAEAANGPIPAPVSYDYIWGDALKMLNRLSPDVRIINLETAITTSDAYWKGKGINYRMSPENVPCLTAAKIDCCVLANNHVLDWNYSGLSDTLNALHKAGIRTAGAGNTLSEAHRPAIIEMGDKGRVVIFSLGHTSSGIPPEWAATARRAGLLILDKLSEDAVHTMAKRVRAMREPGDILIASIHWGGNWGYKIPQEQRLFAHGLIDEAGFNVIHAHSSHHPKGIEVYRDRPILYGCGDLLNDYEGIKGYEAYRDDLSLMYFPTLDTESGTLIRFELIPMQIRNFRLNTPSDYDREWLMEMLNREGERFGTRVTRQDKYRYHLSW